MSGIVYILANQAMPGIVKIGKTERCPYERARELFSTGVPVPFSVVYAAWVHDHDLVEHQLHAEFEAFRVVQNREFFRVDRRLVIQRLIDISVDNTGVGVTFCQEDIYLLLDKICEVTGLSANQSLEAMRFLSVEAINAAAAKYQAACDARDNIANLACEVEE